MRLHAAEALVIMLERFGVRHVFGLPGNNAEFYDAIKRRGAIKHVLVRHEQCAGHMADGYARATRRVGVCDASPGPGITNLLTGISQAQSDGIPVLAVLGASTFSARGRGQFQEVDQPAIFAPVTKAVIEIDCAARVPELMRRAFRIATTGKPGPVAVNLPKDIGMQMAEFSESDFDCDPRFGAYPALRIRPLDEDLIRTLEMLESAQHPVIWCGGGVLNADASADVTALVEQLGIPVVTTFMGKGSLPENHPLCLGPAGAIGRPPNNKFVLESDLVLALGSRFTDTDTAGWTVPRPGTTIVQVDIDPEQLGANLPAKHVMWADLREFARALLAHAAARGWHHPRAGQLADEAGSLKASWQANWGPAGTMRKPDLEQSPVHPLQVIDALRDSMRPGDVLICDSGFNQIFGGKFFDVHEPGRSYIGPRGMGTMGFSFPAAIGARIGRPDQRFVALCGDGGFAMVLQELETALRTGTSVVVVLLNNRTLEYIKWGQRSRTEGRYFSVDYGDTNFAAVAQAFGCKGIRVEHAGELRDALATALASSVTTVIDVMTPDDASPFVAN